MPNLAPIRQRIRTFLTPDIRDFIVAESKDVSYKAIPAYGTPHPDKKKYPDHVFAFPQPADEQGLMYTLLYIMKRADQDAYNWEMQDAGVSDPKFLQVRRSYVTLRSEFNPTAPAMGETMPNVPKDRFPGAFVLADRQQRRSQDQELDTLFVVEDLTYIQKEIFTDVQPDPQSGIAYAITTTLYYRGEEITSGETTQAVELWFADPTHAYWSTDELGFGRTGKQLTDNWFAVTYGKVVDLDTIWEKGSDRLRPSKFYCPQDIVTSTVITANNTPGEPSAPGAGSGQSITVAQVGRIRRVKTTSQTGTPKVLKSLDLLPDDGVTYPKTEELVTLASVPEVVGNIDANGKVIEYQPLDGCDASKVTRQAVSLKNAHVKSVERLVPERFLADKSTRTVEVTQAGVETEPDQPTAVSKKRITVRQKGFVRKTETVEQIGTETPLPGLGLNASDGKLYVSKTEVVPRAAVPLTNGTISTDGTTIEYTPIDADWAQKTTATAVSIEPENRKRTSKLPPDRFYRDNQVASIELVSTGVTSPIVMPTVALGTDVDITQKGAIRTTRTITPPGPLAANKGSSFDERTGETFVESIEVVPIESVVPTFVGADGTLVSFQPLDANWSIKRTSRVASTLTRSWTEITNYEWPAVLTSLNLKVFNAKNGRGSVIYVSDKYKQGFNGPQQMQVSQYWQKDEPTVILPVNLVAEGFDYQSPLFNVRVPPCLHGGYIMRCLIGSSDPDWEAALDVEYFPPTTYTDWPAQVFWRESQPRYGGYLVTEYTINRPTP